MQSLFEYKDPIKYIWEPINCSKNLSLKNSRYFKAGDGEYIFATDMLRGGTVVLKNENGFWVEHMICFLGWTMMWNPYPIVIDGELWLYVCDTAGGDLSHWWDYMRFYRHKVDLKNKTYGELIGVNIFEDNCGFIDPCLVSIAGKWYMFYAKLWDPKDNQWWDPHYSISDSPFGPFTGEYHLGIQDRGIDEAFKVVVTPERKMLYTSSTGDSGIDGYACIGEVVVDSIGGNGEFVLRADEKYKLQATDSELCTALDISAWPRIFGTLRYPGYDKKDLRNNFYLGELK